MKKNSPLKIFIVAGEMSGDILGAKLINRIKGQGHNLVCKGVGGPQMTAEGVESVFPIQEIALFGFFEILPHIFKVKKLIKKTIDEANKFKPDVIITIDSPGFNFRVIEGLEGLRCKKIHYVAPSIWIKPKRVKFLEKHYDKVLAILPFEKKYFENSKVECSFIGHPAIEDSFVGVDKQKFRNKYKIADDQMLLVVMTGSRKSEYTKLTSIFLEAIGLMHHKTGKRIVAAFPYVSNQHKEFLIRKVIQPKGVNIVLVPSEEKKELYSAANLALVKSGTSSLEIAVAKLPIVVAYKVSAVSAWIARNILKFKGFVSIVNLLGSKKIIPELLQEECTATSISKELVRLLKKDEADYQINQSQIEIKKLKPENKLQPSEAAASEVLKTFRDDKIL